MTWGLNHFCRKPRLNPQLVPQVFSASLNAKPKKDKESKEQDKSDRKSDNGLSGKNRKTRPRYVNLHQNHRMA